MSNNNNDLTLSAPLSGPVLALGNVPDEVFASGAMGDGLAIDPLNDCLHAPCEGEIIQVARTGHALTIRADNGAELLMHVGIDTVALNGQGFALRVEQGARVSRGQVLLQFDLDRVARHCKSLISLIILTNGEHFQLRPLGIDSVKVGEPLMQITARAAASVRTTVDSSDAEASALVRVTHRGGLHARPAALIRKAAQGFSSQSRLHFAGHSAA
ncbi:glucose PTS transporter subunit IIA, partial [Pseudomonas rhodesiae]|uniref:glucose PTS transporter subunit IIA n=1 Tax=Pseudomonas rhodesiae TaxID=76760 RepID=UPI0028AB836A